MYHVNIVRNEETAVSVVDSAVNMTRVDVSSNGNSHIGGGLTVTRSRGSRLLIECGSFACVFLLFLFGVWRLALCALLNLPPKFYLMPPVHMDACAMVGNSGINLGGALEVSGSQLVITRSLISSNTGDGAGAVGLADSTLVLSNCTVINNVGHMEGGNTEAAGAIGAVASTLSFGAHSLFCCLVFSE